MKTSDSWKQSQITVGFSEVLFKLKIVPHSFVIDMILYGVIRGHANV